MKTKSSRLSPCCLTLAALLIISMLLKYFPTTLDYHEVLIQVAFLRYVKILH